MERILNISEATRRRILLNRLEGRVLDAIGDLAKFLGCSAEILMPGYSSRCIAYSDEEIDIYDEFRGAEDLVE